MYFPPKHEIRPICRGFSLIELLVVMVIISILMTAGAIGLKGMGGKGVTSAVTTSEALFNEARATAKARNIRACVLIAKSLVNNPEDDLRRILVAYEELDPVTGEPVAGPDVTPNWVLSSRGILLPERVFFSEQLSRENHEANTGEILTQELSGDGIKTNYLGEYYIYQFNGEGVCLTPGASFVVGSGSRNTRESASSAPPVVTADGEKDFGGFVVWRNGGTSVFRIPNQITDSLPSPGNPF